MKYTAVLAIVFMASLVMAEDWPQWRGAKADGISMDASWSPESVGNGKVLWKKNVGEGFSTVSVVKEHVFAFGNSGGTDQVFCLNAADGTEVWKYTYPCSSPKQYPGPRSTPTVDAASPSVYVLSREGELHCIDAAKGSVKWKKSLKSELGAQAPKWDFASSVLLAGDMLIVNASARGTALNKNTGAKIWSGDPGIGGYSTPVLYNLKGKDYVAIFGEKNAYGLDLKTGAAAWSYPWETSYDVNAADPIIRGAEVLITSGYGKGAALLDISEKPRSVWENKVIRSHFGCLLEKDGFIYGLDGQAGGASDLRCFDFKTGQQKWTQRAGFGAIVGAGDKIIMLGQDGKLTVCNMTPDGYKEIASTQLSFNGKCWIMPVLANGRIYCKSQGGDLVCLDARK
jgi:outer membrane protein assembly factor BamB